MKKKYSCPKPDCFITFDFPSHLIIHLATSHKTPQNLKNFISTNPDSGQGWECVFRRKPFGTKGGALLHLVKHHANVIEAGKLEINLGGTVASHFRDVIIDSDLPAVYRYIDRENVEVSCMKIA